MTERSEGRAYLARVQEKLKKRIEELEQSIEAGKKEVEGMHEYYWENYTEMDQYGYENYDNQQALLTQVNANQEQRTLRHRLKKMLESPFFGRVDFRYEDEEDPETFYIGISNFSEHAGRVPLIYDWRAPVSGLFYDFDKGPAYYEAPAGTLEGEICSKWQYKIRHGKMVYEFESDIKIDDEILGAELAGHGETQLKNIVRTIQKEQNAIIRNTKDKIMVIQGAAGSGKTSIALHRIAYLLYHDRKNLKSSNVLILSPNSVFADYISHILPELGEENIQEMSFDLFAYQQLKDTAADCEELYDHLERELKCPDLVSSGQEKQSEGFLNELEGFLLELEDGLMNFTKVEHRGFVRDEGQIIRLFYDKFPDIPLLSRMDAVAEYFIDEVETLRNTDMEEEERELVLGKFRKMYVTRDIYVIYNRFLREYGLKPLPDLPVEKRHIPYEDVYPLLYLKYRLHNSRIHKNIKHLIIDEMQDYSRLQYRIIREIFPCRMTILGDRMQKMEAAREDAMEFLPEIFGKNIRKIVMNKSYRNTVEIAAYAGQYAEAGDVELFERHGKPVEEIRADSMEEAAKDIAGRLKHQEDGYETAAVILRTEEEAERMWMLLKEKAAENRPEETMEIHWMNRNSTRFRKGLTVTTYYLAKGLEFEQVFSVFPARDQRELIRKAKYIAATRALHELTVYHVDEEWQRI